MRIGTRVLFWCFLFLAVLACKAEAEKKPPKSTLKWQRFIFTKNLRQDRFVVQMGILV
jgi:hypothetical protein